MLRIQQPEGDTAKEGKEVSWKKLEDKKKERMKESKE